MESLFIVLIKILIIFVASITIIPLLVIAKRILFCPSNIWERNREAAKLIRKYNRGEFSGGEPAYFKDLQEHGIITIGLAFNAEENRFVGKARLSAFAIKRFF